MFPITQKNTSILLFIAVLVAVSLACDAREIIADTDIELSTVDQPNTTTNEEVNVQEEPDIQTYLGTSQIENISVEAPEGIEDCPPEDMDLGPGGVVNHEISGDKLITTDDTGALEYSYDTFIDAFCRKVPSKMINNQDVVDTEITECVSFHTTSGVKEYNLRRYYLRNDVNVLCYNQHNTIKKIDENLSETEADSTLIEQCIAPPKMYEVEFANVNREYSNESKDVCQGDFIIQNRSSETLSLRYYSISDNGAMHSEGWTYLHIGIEPGESTERYFGTQEWTDGKSTIDTFSKLIVVINSIDCTNLIRDENIALWSEYIIPLNDPCR